jgi:MioC protein
MITIPLFVATMTGTAEMISEEIILQVPDHRFTQYLLDKTSIDHLKKSSFALFVSSTYGEGEVPEPTAPFLRKLEEMRPELSRLTYGIISLGDSASYPATFAAGGRNWDRVLQQCGASRHGELCIIDAADTADPVDRSLEWVSAWLQTLSALKAT